MICASRFRVCSDASKPPDRKRRSGCGRRSHRGATVEVESVLETFDALLRIGQIEAGARRAGFASLDLAEIAREVVEAFRPTAEEQGRVLFRAARRAVALEGDRELLTQMIANCLDNALTHTPPESGSMLQRGADLGCDAQLADSGPGVPKRSRETFRTFLSRGRIKSLAGQRPRSSAW